MPTDKRKERYHKLAMSDPRLTILSDHPLSPDETYRDSFNLDYHLGPVFDIIRHNDTVTPMTIAIYGDWGTGKTTAMKWLEGLIDIWNEYGKLQNGIFVTPVWFYPWKYDNKEDVWRGLIAEVIIKIVQDKKVDEGALKKAARFGLFLGKSFLGALESVSLKAGIGGVAEAEVSFSEVKEKVLAEYQKYAHPEKAFLNEFETTLESWIKETLGKNERMVIFIDDLDRCMPEIALQVLEALKLYLNIQNIIFVVGVDRTVIDSLVKGHYKELKLDGDKSQNYLAKMFQVEVDLTISEQQIEDFLDKHLETIKLWQELPTEDQKIFKDFIIKRAGRNPREIKRLINGAIIEGSGTRMLT